MSNNNYKEADIRPEIIRQNYWALLEKEVAKFLDEDKNVKAEFSVHIDCPLCGANSYKMLFKKRGFTFVACDKCSLVYINPVLEENKLWEFYNSEALDYMQNVILKNTSSQRKQKIHIPRAEIIKDIAPNGRLLEIGCSVGYFLEAAKEVGNWELYGVELNKKSAAYVRENLDIMVFNDFVENLDIDEETFNVVVSFEVIEHTINPLDVLKKAYKILKKDGYFFVSTPNIEGFDFKVLGKHNRSFSPPGHLVYFTPTTFVDILNRAGFKDVKVQTPGKLDVENVRNELLRSPNLTLEMDPFLRELLLADGEKFENARENFQKYLADNGFSSHMIALCKK